METKTYFLGGFTRRRVAEGETIKIQQLQLSEVNQIMKAISKVGQFDNNRSLYDIYLRNYSDLISYWENLQTTFVQEKRDSFSDEIRYEIILEVNRRLLNYVAGFRIFVDHYETYITRSDQKKEKHFKAYKDLLAHYFDKEFAYRLFYHLRNYVLHASLPISRLQFASIDPETHLPKNDDTSPHIVAVYLNRDILLEEKRAWNAKMRIDLANQPLFIEIMPLVQKLHRCVHNVHIMCIQLDLDLIRPYFNLLAMYIARVHQIIPGAYPLLLTEEPVAASEAEPAYTDRLINYFPSEVLLRIQQLLTEPII